MITYLEIIFDISKDHQYQFFIQSRYNDCHPNPCGKTGTCIDLERTKHGEKAFKCNCFPGYELGEVVVNKVAKKVRLLIPVVEICTQIMQNALGQLLVKWVL